MVYCNACGSEVPEGARFCQNCGAALHGAADAQAPPMASDAPLPNPPSPFPYAPNVTQSPPNMPIPPHNGSPYPPPPYPVVPGQPFVPARNGKAIAGMWIGIVSIFPGPLFNWVGIVIGIVGLIFSLLALPETQPLIVPGMQPLQRPGRTQAMIGLICSVIGIILATVVLVYILNHLDKFGIKLTR